MNLRAHLIGLLVLTAATSPVVRAQLIHISFSKPDNVVILQAASPSIPWDIGLGQMTTMDLYFNPAAATDMGGGRFEFSDPSNAYWQARVPIEDVQTFVITRPLQFLQVNPTSFSFEHVTDDPELGLEEFYFDASFTGSIAAGEGLPTTPLPPLLLDEEGDNFMFFLRGSGSLFEMPGLVDAYGIGGFESATLRPIPEPSTYAWGALGLIAVVVLARRVRGARAHPVNFA